MHKDINSSINFNNEKILFDILNSLDALIYVTDFEYKILFINNAMKKAFYDQDFVGQLCYKLLQSDMNDPCPFCPMNQLKIDPTTPVIWEEHNTLLKKYFKNVDTVIDWVDGRKVHIQHSLDISDIKAAEFEIKKQIRQQKLLSFLSLQMLDTKFFEQNIHNCLDAFLQNFNFNFAGLYEFNSNNNKFYLSSGCGENLIGEVIEKDNKIILDNLFKGELYRFIENTNNIYLFPIMISKSLWGTFAVDIKYSDDEFENDLLIIGHITNIFASGIERKIIEQELQEAEKSLRDVLDNVPIGIFWKNRESVYTGCNKLFLKYNGFSNPEEVIGKKDSDKIAGPDQIEYYMKTDADVLAGESIIGKEINTTSNDGEKIWLRINKVPVYDDNGVVVSILGTVEDVTIRKKLELDLILRDKHLEQSVKEANKANNAKGEFLSRMSHEIRTPINAIIGMTYLASNSNDLGKVKSCLEKIDASSRNLLTIINDILDMSKIEANKLVIVPEEFSLKKIFEDIKNICSYKAEEKNIVIQINTHPGVKSQYIGDSMRISQVLTNFLTNAIKFSPQYSEIKMNISLIETNAKNTLLEFSIIDQGIGLSQEQIGRLFTPFEQAEGGTSRKFGGTGLGLAICKSLVTLMGGEIGCHSQLGKGSTFFFRLHLDNIASEKLEIASMIDRSKLRVLVVDDSQDILEFFKELLEDSGISTTTASSGLEAIGLAAVNEKQGKPFDIIFVDWRMPELDGIETARRIKEQSLGKETFIILISIADWKKIEISAREVGIKRFLPKPLFPSEIINLINEVLGLPNMEPTVVEDKNLNLEGKRILLAEDIEINAEILISLLEDTKVEIIVANDGQKAYDIFRNDDNFDLIFMDIHMPNIDGYQSTKMIRQINTQKAKSIPIIAMTANAFKEDVDRCLANGMNDHIAKPIDINVLFEKLHQYFSIQKELKEDSKMEKVDTNDFLPYYDLVEGLGRLRGNKGLYSRLVNSYCQSLSLVDFKKALEENSHAALDIIHTIKGTSANLSMKLVFEQARALEAKLKVNEAYASELADLEDTIAKSKELLPDLLAFLAIK